MVLTKQQLELVMPRTHDAHWVGFQATAAEKEVLDNYCQRMQQSKTQVLRSLVKTLSYPDGEGCHWLLKLELGSSHARIVDQHCKDHSMLPSDVVRYAIHLLGQTEIMHLSGDDAKTFIEMINNPPEPSEQLKELMRSQAPWESSVITEKSEIKPWLESIMAEADKEMALAEQLRANATQLQSIAAHMLTAAKCLETR
jgi:hypothetical protein